MELELRAEPEPEDIFESDWHRVCLRAALRTGEFIHRIREGSGVRGTAGSLRNKNH